MSTSKFDLFVANHLGKAMDYDGVPTYDKVQCVDLIKFYLDEVFGIIPGAWGNAHAYYDNYESNSALKAAFTRIANTPSFVPQKGDIGIYGTTLNSEACGHVCVCTGEGDTTYFYAYDQNWTSKACTKIRHNYNHFLGVLRPKNQTVFSSTTTTSTTTKTSTTVTTESAKSTFKSYKVKVTVNALNIRANAGTNYAITGTIRDKGVYTIVAEKTGKGATKWGKLKSGVGWISLDYVKKT